MITMIVKENCTRCAKIKAYLMEKKIDYTQVNIKNDYQLNIYRKLLSDNGNEPGFPIILAGKQIINGTEEQLKNYINNL